MRNLINALLLSAVVVPGVALTAPAAAQSREELRRDRQDIRNERRDLDRAWANGDRRDVREQRQDLREARQEYREDLRGARGGDWRQWREGHRDLYARGRWQAPFRYQAFGRGARIDPRYYGPRYVIANPGRYRLPAARGPMRWVRHYDDALLVDQRRGVVIDVIRRFYR